MVVYYTLAGGSQGTTSALMCADPHDGIDNYFIYSYGNVTYCGAGHTLITGINRANNDERRLFINVILNSAKKSVFTPTINIYDPYPTTNGGVAITDPNTQSNQYKNKQVTLSNGMYEITVPNIDTLPEFSYQVSRLDKKDSITEVKIFFDLSKNSSDTSVDDFGYDSKTDKLIYDSKRDDSVAGSYNPYTALQNGNYVTVGGYTEAYQSGKDLNSYVTGPVRDSEGKSITFKSGNDDVILRSLDLTETVNGSKVRLDADGNAYRFNTKLDLKEEYFKPYGDYTIIVVSVKTANNKVLTKRIKVSLPPKLWDLT
jgi:hypothetical protein